MSLSRTTATAARVLSQLRRDPRTIVLLIVVPCVLMILVDQLFAGREAGVPERRSADARDLPADQHVPRHLDHDAARAHDAARSSGS